MNGVLATNQHTTRPSSTPRQDVPRNVGLLVLTPDLQLVHSTRAAWDVLRELHDQTAQRLLPLAIIQLAEEILKRIRGAKTSGEWEHSVVHKVVDSKTDLFTLYGFVLPDKRTSAPAYIVIHTDRRRPHDGIFAERRELYQLSERETRIVQCLAKGLTNKEIGHACGIEEPTVKAHIKRVMEKTGATTRTAILSRLYGL